MLELMKYWVKTWKTSTSGVQYIIGTVKNVQALKVLSLTFLEEVEQLP